MRRILAAAALLLCGPASAALFEPPARPNAPERGHWRLQPYAQYSEVYDSNVFLARSPIASWIHVPGAGAALRGSSRGRHEVDLSYDGAYRLYTAQGIADAPNHTVDGRYWYSAPGGGVLRLRDYYLNTIDPDRTELTGLRRRWMNAASAETGYAPEEGRVALLADGTVTRHKFVADDPVVRSTLNRVDTLFGARAGWRARPKTLVYAAYHRELLHFTDAPSPSRDSRGDLVDLGVEGELAPKVGGRAQAGFVKRRYDAAPAGGDRDALDATALVSLTWRALERSRMDLALSRSLQESSFQLNRFYTATAARLTLAHELPWRLLVSLSATAERDDYPDSPRRDDNYSGSAELQYPLGDRLRASASYLRRARFVRAFSELGFADDITTVALRLTL